MSDNLHKPTAWVHVSPGGTEDIIMSASCQCGRPTCSWTFTAYMPHLAGDDSVPASVVRYDTDELDNELMLDEPDYTADDDLVWDGLDEEGEPLPTDPNQVVVDMVAYKNRTGR